MAKYEYVAPKVVEDLKSLMVDGEAIQLDFTEDAWEFGAPPPGGQVYKVKLFVDKEGLLQGLEDQGNPKTAYFQVKLIAKIVEGEYEGTPIYTQVTSRVWRGKSISTMGGLLSKLVSDVSKIPNPITPKRLCGLLMQVLAKEPICKAELDWRGSYPYPDPKDPKVNLYENVFRHYREFPEDKENPGMKQHIVMVTNKHTGGTEEVRAQTQISSFYGAKEEVKVKTKASVPVGKKVAEVPDLELEKPKPTVVTGKGNVKVEEDEDADMQLMLAE